jgi:hypothetical protein
VITLDNQAAVTPAGKPVAAPIPVAPVVECVMVVKTVLIQSVGAEEAAVTVFALTVTLTKVVVKHKLSGVKVYTKVPTESVEIVAGDQVPVIAPELDGNSVSAGFGTTFPTNPTKGDLYLRVDYLPSRLYKWNDAKWIEVDKTTPDVYSYDTEYIRHLTNKIASGEYDVDLLTPAEQEQIQQYIKNNPQ